MATAVSADETSGSRATIRLEKKHPLAIRWMHWVNFPVLFTMIWSGMLIYWNDSDNAYRHPHAVYRVGIGQADAGAAVSGLGSGRRSMRRTT